MSAPTAVVGFPIIVREPTVASFVSFGISQN